MSFLTAVIAVIDPNGCKEIPMVQSATQTFFNYVNGNIGYVIFAVGIAALAVAVFGRKWLSQLPGWISGIILIGLAVASFSTILGAFGIDMGCGGGGGGGGASTGNGGGDAPADGHDHGGITDQNALGVSTVVVVNSA